MPAPTTTPVTSLDRRSAPVRLVARHPLGAFFAWFFTVGQALAFIPVLVDDLPAPRQVFIVASTLIGLLLPAALITRIADGPAGLRALWRQAFHVRMSLGWYALALLIVPLTATAIAVVVLGPPADPSVLASALAANLLLPLLLTFVPNNWWEEVAWMGFVQARLQSRRGPVLAAVLTAPLFALQHISLTVGNPVSVAVLIMVLLAALAIPFRFLIGWAYNRTASLFLVGLVHGAGNRRQRLPGGIPHPSLPWATAARPGAPARVPGHRTDRGRRDQGTARCGPSVHPMTSGVARRHRIPGRRAIHIGRL